jgi:hypothetical protein
MVRGSTTTRFVFLTPGKLADCRLVQLPSPEDELPGAQVIMTLVGGMAAYERGRERFPTPAKTSSR